MEKGRETVGEARSGTRPRLPLQQQAAGAMKASWSCHRARRAAAAGGALPPQLCRQRQESALHAADRMRTQRPRALAAQCQLLFNERT
jgi:hypothetical protein